MLLSEAFFPYVCKGLLLLSLIIFLCTWPAYRANDRLPMDDPNKRSFHIGAVILSTIGWPLLLLLYTGFFLLKALTLGVSLIVVTIALIVFRKPFLVVWIKKISAKIGNMLLELNTALIYAFLGKESKKPPL